jgi:hypothetical protein
MTSRMDPLTDYRIWRRYTQRFAPCFCGALILAMLCVAANMSLTLDFYFHAQAHVLEYSFIIGMTLAVITMSGQLLVIRGLRWGVGVLLITPTLCLLLSTCYLRNTPINLLNSTTALWPLLYLLAINSRKHRRFVKMLAVRRRRRIRDADFI